MCYKDSLQLSTAQLSDALATLKSLGGVAAIHAENGDVIRENEKRLLARGMAGPEAHLMSRPEEAEEEAVTRACAMARQARAPIVLCGPTSRAAADVVRRASAGRPGPVVWTEATAVAMAAGGDNYYDGCWDRAAGFVCAPPLRDDPGAPDALAQAVADGAFQMVVSDHRSYSRETKAAAGRGNFVNIPHGVNGAEERMAVAWEKVAHAKRTDAEGFVRATSAAAARALGVYPRKGRVAEGSDADVVVWNVNNVREISARAHAQKGDFNAFEGLTVHGAPEFVVSGGRVAVFEYRLNASLRGGGAKVDLPSRPPAIYDAVDDLDRADAAASRPVDRSGQDQVQQAQQGQQVLFVRLLVLALDCRE